MATQRQVSDAIQMMRWLGRELYRDDSTLSHVPDQIADMLLTNLDGCTVCGGPMPPRATGAGRPRSRCEVCSPPRRKSPANKRMAA
jgi:hypothetical protein